MTTKTPKLKEKGRIEFIHIDGKEHVFMWETNSLNTSWMYTWDKEWLGCWAGNKRSVKSIIKSIKEKTTILNSIGC